MWGERGERGVIRLRGERGQLCVGRERIGVRVRIRVRIRVRVGVRVRIRVRVRVRGRVGINPYVPLLRSVVRTAS